MEFRSLAAKTLIQSSVVALVVAACLVLVFGAEVWFVVFAGMLYAIILNRMAAWITRKTGLPEKWAVAFSITAPLLLFGAAAWLLAPDVTGQASELARRLPEAATKLRDDALGYDWVVRLVGQMETLQASLPSSSRLVNFAAGAVASTVGALGNILLAFVVGVFLAINPRIYVGGLLRLVPPRRRARAQEVLAETESTLAAWLIAKLLSMAAIGVLTLLGLWLIGIDLALVLALIAAMLSFIPNVGPVLALVPAVLIALVAGPDEVLYVVSLYVGVQIVESYVLTPYLQQKMLELPPALTVGTQVLLGVLAGALGVILATPLTAAAVVMTRMWYVEDLLGDRPPRATG
ncbi:AI-2E family transporter [Polaromonas sp.]|jgi:predicted PurR-regulated permease PerM|uniref:AI-2E family transporter n=1 Tax=Polaromonas sp. TaxID=1869339 RepID=UPI002BA77055|nr:AI-2E family transporter [Polaromonas sp.]HQS30371.1 AI-2E family transporter [Polaromonas sp.]HQS90369.1 AI-2E family transporter [Polaromonas sp.]